jgi:serine/threonine-protein kinase HipA
MTLAEVKLWGRRIGAVSLEDGGRFAAFQYDPAFAGSGIEISPITMPLSDRVYVFPTLPERTFYGLPGLLADSLPDRFGNALIDAWLATRGRTPESFNAVERLVAPRQLERLKGCGCDHQLEILVCACTFWLIFI